MTTKQICEHKQREARQWWVISGGEVKLVTGYSCSPTSPGMWWCPEVGFSASEGFGLFITKDEATVRAIHECEHDLKVLQNRLIKLKSS